MTIHDFFIDKSAKKLSICSKLALGIYLFFAYFTPTFAADLMDIIKRP